MKSDPSALPREGRPAAPDATTPKVTGSRKFVFEDQPERLAGLIPDFRGSRPCEEARNCGGSTGWGA